MNQVSRLSEAGAAFTLLLLAACGRPEPSALDEDEMPTCWVYKGLSEEEIARMEAWCNEYAVCSSEDGEACSGTPGGMEQ